MMVLAKKVFRELWFGDEAQDLVEYALLVALVALAATAGMNTMAGAVNNAFKAVGSRLGVYTT